MRKSLSDIYAGIGFLAIGIAFGVQYEGLSGVSRVFPEVLISIIVLGGLYFIAKGLWLSRREKKQTEEEEAVAWGRIAVIVIMSFLYLMLLSWLGFFSSTFAFLLISSIILGDRTNRPLLRSVVFSIPFTVVVWLLFVKLLNVPAPDGLLF